MLRDYLPRLGLIHFKARGRALALHSPKINNWLGGRSRFRSLFPLETHTQKKTGRVWNNTEIRWDEEAGGECHIHTITQNHVRSVPDVMLLLTLITLVILPVCANVGPGL